MNAHRLTHHRASPSPSPLALRVFALVGVVAFGCSALTLGGCNTTKGMGEDLEETGENIQDAAEKTKDKLSD